MKLFNLFICFLVSLCFKAQTTVKGILIDSTGKQPIEFANIGIPGKGIGTVSDEYGKFSLVVPDSVAKEPVRISMIGYKPKTISFLVLEKNEKVLLAQNHTMLQEVAVSVKKSKTKILGNETRTSHVSGGFKKNSLGAEIAVKLEIKHPQTHIKKAMININKNTLDKKPVFRLNVYSCNEKGMPDKNILDQNIIIEPAEKQGFIEIDLIPYHIFANEDVFISLEWIKDLGDVTGLYFSTKLFGNGTYFRLASQDKWEKVASIGVGLYAEVAY